VPVHAHFLVRLLYGLVRGGQVLAGAAMPHRDGALAALVEEPHRPLLVRARLELVGEDDLHLEIPTAANSRAQFRLRFHMASSPSKDARKARTSRRFQMRRNPEGTHA
jgi:hypothetical protein